VTCLVALVIIVASHTCTCSSLFSNTVVILSLSKYCLAVVLLAARLPQAQPDTVSKGDGEKRTTKQRTKTQTSLQGGTTSNPISSNRIAARQEIASFLANDAT
jgi:hypothetical protein